MLSSSFERWTAGERTLSLRLFGAVAYPASFLYRAAGLVHPPLSRRFSALRNAKLVVISSPLVGGVGKTPLTALLATRLTQDRQRATIVTLGYGRSKSDDTVLMPGTLTPELIASSGDEAAELSHLSAVPVHVGTAPERVIDRLDTSNECDWILFDDGLTRTWAGERRVIALSEDDLVRPIRYVPYGRWRTSPRFLTSGCFVAVTGATGAVNEMSIRQRLSALGYRGTFGMFEYRVDGLASLGVAGMESKPLVPDGRPFAFCGIARPGRFLESARVFGATREMFRAFPDHHSYTSDDVFELEAARKRSGCDWLLTTLKDAVKIDQTLISSTPLRFLRIALHQVAGTDILTALNKDT